MCNYGVAIGGASENGNEYPASLMVTYMIANVYGEIVGGHWILPNYGQTGNGYGLFNGIALRWMGAAINHGYMPSKVVPWAQENIGLAWSKRDPVEMTWDNCDATTFATGIYSHDATPMLVGMFMCWYRSC